MAYAPLPVCYFVVYLFSEISEGLLVSSLPMCCFFFYKAITYFDICLLCFLSEMQLINITLVSTERTTNNASVCRCNSQCCCDGRLCRLQSNHVAGFRSQTNYQTCYLSAVLRNCKRVRCKNTSFRSETCILLWYPTVLLSECLKCCNHLVLSYYVSFSVTYVTLALFSI